MKHLALQKGETYPHYTKSDKMDPWPRMDKSSTTKAKDNLGVTRLPHCRDKTQNWGFIVDRIIILNLLDTIAQLT